MSFVFFDMVGPAVKELNLKGGGNKFKFSSFQDQISRVKVDLLRSALPHHASLYSFDELDADTHASANSFFISSAAKWRETNLTADFKAVAQKLYPISESLVQVIFHKDSIVSILLQSLSEETPNAIEPAFELIEALAKDLQDELYPKIPQVFHHFLTLLSPESPIMQNARLTQLLFNCTAALFKIFSRKLADDITVLFPQLFLPLLEHTKTHIRQFGAEAVGYLLRKLPETYFRNTVSLIFTVPCTEVFADGVTRLFVAMLKGVNGKLQSRARLLTDIILRVAATAPARDSYANALLDVWAMLQNYVSAASELEQLEDVLLDRWRACTTAKEESEWLDELLLTHIVSHAGSKVSNWKALYSSFCKALETRVDGDGNFVGDFPVSLAVALLYYGPKSLDASIRGRVFSAVVTLDAQYSVIISLKSMNWSNTLLEALLLPHATAIVEGIVASGFPNDETVLRHASVLEALPFSLLIKHSQILEPYFTGIVTAANLEFETLAIVIEQFTKFLEHGAKCRVPWSTLIEKLKVEDAAFKNPAVHGRILDSCHQCKAMSFNFLFAHWLEYFRGEESEHHPLALEQCRKFVVASVKHVQRIPVETVIPIFAKDLCSYSHSVRLNALGILASFKQCKFNTLNTDSDREALEWKSKPNSIFELLYESESVYPNQITTHRVRMMPLSRLNGLFKKGRIPAEYNQLYVNYVVALFSEDFSPLWKDLRALMGDLVRGATPFRKIIFDRLLGLLIEFQEKGAQLLPTVVSPSRSLTEAGTCNVFARARFGIERDLRLKNLKLIVASSKQVLSSPIDTFSQKIEAENRSLDRARPVDFTSLQRSWILCLALSPDLVVNGAKQFLPWVLKKLAVGERRDVLLGALEVVSQLKKPGAIGQSSELSERLLELLQTPDSAVQKLALRAFALFANNVMERYNEPLQLLTEESTWREALQEFDDMEELFPNLDDREPLLRVLSSLVFSRLSSRKRKTKGKFGVKAQRAILFSFVASREPALLTHLYSKMSHGVSHGSECTRQYRGYLSLLQSMVKQLGAQIFPLLPQMFADLSHCCRVAAELQAREKDIVDKDLIDSAVTSDSVKNSGESSRDEHLFKIFPSEQNIDSQSDTEKVNYESSEKRSESSECPSDSETAPINENDGILERERPGGKPLRKLLFQNLVTLFSTSGIEDQIGLSDFARVVHQTLIVPRLDNFVSEYSQSVGSLLLLLRCWVQNKATEKFLIQFDDRVIPKLLELLSFARTKRAVIENVVKIFEGLTLPDRSCELVRPYMSVFLESWTTFFRQDRYRGDLPLQSRLLGILSRVCEEWRPGSAGQEVVFTNLLIKVMSNKSRKSSEEFLLSCLKIVELFFPHLTVSRCSSWEDLEGESLYSLLLHLVSEVKQARTRQLLSSIMARVLSKPSLLVGEQRVDIGALVVDMNRWSRNRMGEPDYEKRFTVFQLFQYELVKSDMSASEMLPLLHNFLYFMRDDGDYSTRNGAQFCLQCIVERGKTDSNLEHIVHYTIVPAIKKAIRFPNMPVRQGYLELFGGIVAAFPETYSYLVPLLANGDPEANFFLNIHHMQLHRRVRALHRLIDIADTLAVSLIGKFFIPLFMHFVYELEKVQEQLLVNEAITSIGKLSSKLSWSYYSHLLQGVIEELSRKPWMNKKLIRLLVSITDNFSFSFEDAKVKDTVLGSILPCLLRLLLEQNANSDIVELRVPVALSVAKLISNLTDKELEKQLLKVVGKMGDLLKSRIQQIRDVTRNTLKSVVEIVGLEHLPTVINLLKHILTRGPQVHVLIFTVHTLLTVEIRTGEDVQKTFATLAESVMPVVIEDIFGTSAEEKEVAALQKAMQERQGLSKGFSIVEILAKQVPFADLERLLLLPIREIMLEASSLKVGAKIDQLLQKVAQGLSKNAQLDSHACLDFGGKLIKEQMLLQMPPKEDSREILAEKSTSQPWEQNYLVQVKRPDLDGSLNKRETMLKHFKANSFRLVQFGLHVINQYLSHCNFKSLDNFADWERLVNPLGELLYSDHEQHVTLAMQALAYLLQSQKLVNLQKPSARQAIASRVLSLLSSVSSTDSELVQVSFKLLAALFRAKIVLKKSQMKHLLTLVELDLNDAIRQRTSFSLLKALIKCKLVSVELYDLMDTVRELSIKSFSAVTRELARQTIVQFMLDCPQSKDKVRQLFLFINTNLQYEHSSGRLAALSLADLVFSSFSKVIVGDYIESAFLPTLLLSSFDQDPKCKADAAQFLEKFIISRANDSQLKRMFLLPYNWLTLLKDPDAALPMEKDKLYLLCFVTLQIFFGALARKTYEAVNLSKESFWELLCATVFVPLCKVSLDDRLLQVEQMKLCRVAVQRLGSDCSFSSDFMVSLLESFASGEDEVRLCFVHFFGALASQPLASSRNFVEQVFVDVNFSSLPQISSYSESQKTKWLCFRHFDLLCSVVLGESDCLQVVKNVALLLQVGQSLFEVPSDEPRLTTRMSVILEQMGKRIYTASSKLSDQPLLLHQYQMSLMKCVALYINSANVELLVADLFILIKPLFLLLEELKASSASSASVIRRKKGELLSEFEKEHDDLTVNSAQALKQRHHSDLEGLATQMLDLMKTKVGTSKYLEAYEAVHRSVMDKRLERKVSRDQMAVLDPQQFNKRKIARNELKRSQKKRKTVASATKKVRLVTTPYNVLKGSTKDDAIDFED